MLLVTGATGHLGASVVEQLLKKTSGAHFAVLARSEEKAAHYKAQGIEVRIADFNAPETLDKAFVGIEKLLLISTMEVNRFEQHRHVVDAAVRAGVKHIVYTGLAIKSIETSQVRMLMESHFQTEDYIKQSGLQYTLLRNTMYADAIPLIVGEGVWANGIHLPGGNGKVPYVLRREMGEATANLLLEDGHANQTYDIAAAQSYSYQEVADALSRIKGVKVGYHNANPEEYEALLKGLGVPEFVIYLTKGTVLDIKNHQYELDNTVLARLLGRAPKDLDEMLKELYL